MAEPIIHGPGIKGWCPGALRPMLSGDGLVVRVRPDACRLAPEQASGIARLARAHGNGLIDLTSRANIQLRGVTWASYRPLIDGLAELGLINESREAEARRNIVTTPFWSPGDGVQHLAAALSDALAGVDAPALPEKFGFAIDCGPAPVLNAVSADIRLERGADGGLICRADGVAAGASVTAETAVGVALELARWFLASGGSNAGRGRMVAHLARGMPLPASFRDAPARPSALVSPKPGRSPVGFLVGIEFGQMQAETLIALAGHGALRVTPWRMLLIERAETAPDVPGVITRADDPMLRIVSCTGAPGCLQANQPTRPLARNLAPQVPAGGILHVSGCAKGCAHPRLAARTLIAQAQGFDLVHDGRAGDTPDRRCLTAQVLAAEPAILFEAS